jgi:hypothetical protein
MHPVWQPARLNTRRHFFLIPLAALVATLPLILHGTSCGHDFDFHLLSWFEAATQFAHGNLHPHWAFTPAFNAGEPRFVFYPPISWYLGATLGLILTHLPGVSEAAGWTATPILFTWVALTLSGLTMHRLAREFASPNAAIFAATLYLANPYMLFTAYERTAYAELLAAAWIPLLLLSILRQRVTVTGIAIPLALLWLTNAPAAVMGTYALALLVLFRLGHKGADGNRKYLGFAAEAKELAAYQMKYELDRPTQPEYVPLTTTASFFGRRDRSLTRRDHLLLEIVPDAFNIFAGTALAFALVAFYLLPAAYERRYVQIAMATTAGMKISANFLFEHTGSSPDNLIHDQVLHTVSVVGVILLGATAIALAAAYFRRVREEQWRFPIASLTALTIAIAFLLTPLSLPVWNHTPQLTFLQFSWRLLAILAPVLALATARALSPGAPSQTAFPSEVGSRPLAFKIVGVLSLAAVLSLPAYHSFSQPCDPPDTAPARIALFHSNIGTDATDEYTPVHAENDALAPPGAVDPDATNPSNYPPYWLADSPEARPPNGDSPGHAPMHVFLKLARPEDLILNLRDYPAWHITRVSEDMEVTAVTQRLERPDGLIVIPLPAGRSTIDIRYSLAPDQIAGDAITLVAVPIFLFILRRKPAGC